MPVSRPPKERFWEKVSIAGPNDCWLWSASAYLNGYGQFWTGSNLTPAHRYAYFLVHGPIPPKMVVLHSCDNPRCCNPAHLSLGTQQDNVDDMLRKGRNNQAKGEKQRNAKFTTEKIRQIREMYATGNYSQSELARQFNVSKPNIRSIVLRLTWKHV